MWKYEKRLQYPVNISQTNPKLAMFIISQYGGPDGESGAAMRYLSQRYAMPYEKGKATLTDIGTEESGVNLYQLYFGAYSTRKTSSFRITARGRFVSTSNKEVFSDLPSD